MKNQVRAYLVQLGRSTRGWAWGRLAAMGLCLLSLPLHGCSLSPATATRDPACVSAEAAGLRQQVTIHARNLDYSQDVADALAEMVLGWRCGATPVLVGCKAVLDQANPQSPQAIASAERRVIERIVHRIRSEIAPDKEVFEPGDIVGQRRANCVGYAQLFTIVGLSVGLSIRPAGVLELQEPGPLPEGTRHVCSLVALSDGTAVMVNFAPVFISRPFVLDETYAESGCYLRLNHRGNPLHLYRKIQLLDDNGLLAHLYNSRGVALASRRLFPEALEQYAKAIDLNPRFAEAWNNRGVALRNCGYLDEALSAYDRAIELDGSYPEALNNRALARAKSGWLDDAFRDYNRAAAMNPRSAAVHNNLAVAYHQSGRLREAISQYSLAVELDPNLTEAHYNRANAYGKLGQYRQAIRDYTSAIQRNPRLEQAYINRALSYATLGRYDAARRDLLEAVRIDPAPAIRERVSRISERIGLDLQIAIDEG
jgi:tetratricopeptide (TPR) repeat protein